MTIAPMFWIALATGRRLEFLGNNLDEKMSGDDELVDQYDFFRKDEHIFRRMADQIIEEQNSRRLMGAVQNQAGEEIEEGDLEEEDDDASASDDEDEDDFEEDEDEDENSAMDFDQPKDDVLEKYALPGAGVIVGAVIGGGLLLNRFLGQKKGKSFQKEKIAAAVTGLVALSGVTYYYVLSGTTMPTKISDGGEMDSPDEGPDEGYWAMLSMGNWAKENYGKVLGGLGSVAAIYYKRDAIGTWLDKARGGKGGGGDDDDGDDDGKGKGGDGDDDGKGKGGDDDGGRL